MEQIILNGITGLKDVIGKRKYLLVCDRVFGVLPIKKFFADSSYTVFSAFTPNPLYEQVVEGVNVFRDNQCEMIVAVGGGSTIDVAKCIKLFCKMDSSVNYLKQDMFDTGIELAAIPTTAGTGSESTRHAVIYYDGKKQSISHPSIVPNVAVLEPSLLKGLPVYQKKCTMLDALCQGIESWWSVNSTEESVRYSKKAIQLIKDYWKDYIVNNSDGAAAKIMVAANYAGRAINITATTAAHAMSYKLTSMYHLPHGHAVAVCMPEVWEYLLGHIDNCIDSRGIEYVRKTMADISAVTTLDWFQQLMSELEMAYPISDNKAADVDLLTESVNPVRLKNYPVQLESYVLYGMYERIVQ